MLTNYNKQKFRVLVVDDVDIHLTLISESIKNICEVIIAKDGKKALEIADSANKPDLILLDLKLPDLNGFEVCKILKNNLRTKDIPIIFITGSNESEDEEYGLSIGGIDYITKPFVPSIVNARVNNILLSIRAYSELHYKYELQQMISSIASCFLGKIGYQLRDAVDFGLLRIGEFFGASSVCFTIYNESLNKISAKYNWSPSAGGNSALDGPLSDYNYFAEELWRDEILYITDVDLLQGAADFERQALKRAGVRSVLIVPLFYSGFLRGMISIESTEKVSFILNDDLSLLKIACDIIVNEFARQNKSLFENADDIKPPQIRSDFGDIHELLPEDRDEKNESEFTALIADDEKVSLLLLRSLIKQGFQNSTVLQARNGYEFVELYKQYSPSIVITDINMPIKDGITAIKEIREFEKGIGVRSSAILISSAEFTIEKKEYSDIIDEYLNKPVSYKEICNLIKKHL